MKKVIIFGYHGMLNLGDDEFLSIICSQLSQNHTIKVYGDDEILSSNYSHLNVEGLWSGVQKFGVYQKWLKLVKELINADAMIFCAGSILTILPFKFVYYLLKTVKIINRNLKVYGLGLSIGPFRNESDSVYANKIIELFEKAYLRDDTFNRLTTSNKNSIRCIQALDICFSDYERIVTNYQNSEKSPRLLIALNEHQPNSEKSSKRIHEITLFSMALMTDKLIEGVDLFITCSDKYYGDQDITNKLNAELEALGISTRIYTHDGVVDKSLDLLSQYKYVISSRLHTGFFSFLVGAKVIQLAYAEKVVQFYKYADFSGIKLIDPYEFTSEELLNLMTKFTTEPNEIVINKEKVAITKEAINLLKVI